MDLILYNLIEFGLSKSIIEKNLLGKINYIDIFYPRRRFFESKVFNSSTHSKIINLKNKHNLRLTSRAIDSVYILLNFGVNLSIIQKFTCKSIKTISKIKKLSENDKKMIINKSTDTYYTKLIIAIHEYQKWQKKNFEYLVEIFLLEYIQTGNIDNLNKKVKQKLYNLDIEITDNIITMVLANLQKENIIKITDSNIELEDISLREILSYNIKDEGILKDKLSGKTFKEIGDRLGKTRSRIQQQYINLLNKFPNVIEDKMFSNIYKNYELNKEDFLALVCDDEIIFNYLDSKYEKGKYSIQEYIEKHRISEEIIEKYLKINNKFKNYYDEVLSINHRNIFDDYMKYNKEEIFNRDNLRDKYNKYCVKYNLNPYEDGKKNAFAAIIENSKNIVRSNDGTFRYYNILGIGEMEKELIIESFEIPDGIYGAEKLYELNKELMDALDLKNGYEFLDLIKMLNLDIPKIEKIVRRSEIQIGKSSKKKFIYEILLDFNGESIDEVVDLISDEYGLKRNSLNSYVLDNYKSIITNNKINISIKDYDMKVLDEQLTDMLSEEIYLLRVFNYNLSKMLDDNISVNNKMLNPYGYKTSGRYIIKKIFKLYSEAMEEYILRHTIFRPPSNELFKDSLYYNTRSKLQKHYRLFRFSNDSYITEKVLINGNISIKYIKDFVRKVVEFIEEKPGFYTYYKLLETGFYHGFMDLGFQNIFYESIIIQSDKIASINTTPKIFYINNKKNYNYSEFLYNIIEENITLDYQDFLEILNNEYGISIEQSDLKSKLFGTNAYYSNEIEKYYFNKEQYLLEVYGNVKY